MQRLNLTVSDGTRAILLELAQGNKRNLGKIVTQLVRKEVHKRTQDTQSSDTQSTHNPQSRPT